MLRTGHLDLFARDHLPRKDLQPEFLIFERPEVRYPDRLNAAVELLDRNVEQGYGDRIALRTDDAQLQLPAVAGPGQSHRPRAAQRHEPCPGQSGAASRGEQSR